MSDSPDLLRDAEVLRKLLTECLRRVDRLERRLRIEAAAEADETPTSPLTDPFEQALPERDDGPASGSGDRALEPPHGRTPPRAQAPENQSTVRTLHLGHRGSERDDASPHADPAASRAPQPRPKPTDTEWEEKPGSGDGTIDPFELLDMSVPPPAPNDLSADVYRGMSALLGGLDVTPPNDDA